METGMHLYGGALQVRYLLQGLASCSFMESVLVCPKGSAIASATRGHDGAVYEIPVRGDLDLAFLFRLAKILRKEKPDIVHLHSRRGADVLGGIAAKLTGTPCILTRRVDNPENRLWANVKYRLYDRIITISEGIREILFDEGISEDRTVCVHSAVDAGRFKQPCDRSWFRKEFGGTEGSLCCGVIAQFIARKGHRYLLEAVPDIVRAVPHVRFLFFGKGILEEELKAQCARLGIESKVVFAGFRDDLERIMGCLDLVIHPALMEGLGVSLLQAAAAGVPIVGTRVGGIPEIVQDGVNGLLIPSASVPHIVDAVTRILMDRDLARQMGGKGREITETHFSIESMVDGNLSIYRDILDC